MLIIAAKIQQWFRLQNQTCVAVVVVFKIEVPFGEPSVRYATNRPKRLASTSMTKMLYEPFKVRNIQQEKGKWRNRPVVHSHRRELERTMAASTT